MRMNTFTFLLLAAGTCSLGAMEIPNGGFEQSKDGKPVGWTLANAKGGSWLASGGRAGAAVRVTGDGTFDSRWRSTPCALEPNRCYAFSFWTRGRGAGSVVCGTSSANVDWTVVGSNWTQRLHVFRTPSYEKLGPSAFHLGQWHLSGTADFDDVALVPVKPVYLKSGDLELGHGEQVDGRNYVFFTQFGNVARNHARPLHDVRAGYNTDRWCLGSNATITYRFALPNRTWKTARVSATCGYFAGGTAQVEISRDGVAWTGLASITNSTSVEVDVPSALLPAKEFFLRIRGEKVCNLQIHNLAFDATFDGASAAAIGSTKFVDAATGKVVCETPYPKFYETGYGELLPSASGAVALWRASSGWKVPRSRALPTATAKTLAVKTAANEAEAVQLIVTPKTALRDVRVTAGDLKGAWGHVLSAAAIDVLRVGYVPIKQTTDGVGCRALWPDPLPPQEGALAVAPNANQPFWVRVKPPKGTPAGIYRGALTVSIQPADGAAIQEMVPFEVEVFGFELPDRMTCETAFGFGAGTVARYHGLKTKEQRETVWAKYLQELADHHISPYDPAPGVNWSVTWTGVEVWRGGTLDTDVKFAGKSSVRIVDDTPKGNPSLTYSARVPLGRKGVKISFRYRTATDQSFTFSMGHHKADGRWMSGRNRDFRIPASREWKLFEATHANFPAEAVTAYLAVYPGSWRDDGSTMGTVWLDDLSITDAETGKLLVQNGDFESMGDPAVAEPVFDWTAWDAAMEAAFAKYHFTTFRLGLQGLGGGTYESRSEPEICGVKASDPAYDILMGKYLRGVESHLREKGWLDKAYVYWFDEPEPKDYPFVKRGFETLKRHAPGLRRMLTEEVGDELFGGPNLWVPLTPHLHVDAEAKARAAGDTFWWYVCCGPKAPYVTEFTDHPGTELRLWLWQTWGENVTGILIWETVWWTSSRAYPDPAHPQNPYEDAMCWAVAESIAPGGKSPWGNGDGRFLYPPQKAALPAKEPVLESPVGSFRLEMLRDGLEDYEYFAMLKRALDTRVDLSAAERARYEALLKVPADVYTSLTEFATDPASMETHRLKLARALEELAARTAPLVRVKHTGPGLEGRFHPTYRSVHDPAKVQARAVPDCLRGAVMYQLFTRMFTPEGTFEAARRKLPELQDLGVNVIYLTPHQLSDDDPDPRHWSARQKACKLGNPKNPYRQKDFFAVDPEYGTKEGLKRFIDDAHALGIKVMFDLVYFHCGPKAVFLQEHPEFIVRNADGTPKLGDWAFPEMDIAKPAVREYLYSNMIGLLRDYNVDGFRCDVADMLPVDFWEEGARRCRALKPDVFFMCEGLKGDDQISAFDLTYGFYTQWALVDILAGKVSADLLEKAWRAQVRDYPRGFHWMRCFENHDFANVNPGQKRKEALYGHDLNAAMLATCFLLDGVPMIYNGQEIADAAPHSIFANRDHGAWHIDWSRANDAAAQTRRDLVKRLARLRHANPALFDAPVVWHKLPDPKVAYAFTRTLPGGKSITLAVNISKQPVSFTLPGVGAVSLKPQGFEIR